MIVCLDVHYRPGGVCTGCVELGDWADAEPLAERAIRSSRPPTDYRPGQLYRRELPYLLDALAALAAPPAIVVIDGYVLLGPDRPGLGAHLHEALGGAAAVVGVAKNRFRGATGAVPVLRGRSATPLQVTAVGIDPLAAADAVRRMHGAHRIPTLIRRADQLARGQR